MNLRAHTLGALFASAALVAAPLAAATPALAADGESLVTVDGDMDWDVVSSWKSYVTTIAAGSVTENWNPTGTLNLDTDELNIDLGSIQWDSAEHGFDIAFENVNLAGDANGIAQVTADILGPQTDSEPSMGVLIATLNLDGELGEEGALNVSGEGTISENIGEHLVDWVRYAGADAAPLTLNLLADLPADEEDEEPGEGDPDEGAEDPVWNPQLELFDAAGDPLGNREVTEGDTITVRGSGFDPAANIGGHGIPISAELPQGYYVVFGKFSPEWEPSKGAGRDAREVGDQGWVLAESVLDQVPPNFQGAIRAQWVPLTEDGSFEVTLEASDLEDDGPENGAYGVYIYAAGGVNNADFELGEPVNFAPNSSGDEDNNDNDEVEDGSGNGANDGNNDGNGAGEENNGAANEPDKCLAADSGELVWAIHGSFLSYVTSPIANGKITTSGVTRSGENFVFKLASGSYDSGSNKGAIKYSGSVHFSGHDGELDVELSDPQLHISGDQATLLVDVTTNGTLEKAVPFAVVDAATGSTSATGYSLNAAGTVLTDAGSVAMQDFYPAGTKIAPVTANFSLSGVGDCEGKVVTAPKPNTDVKPNSKDVAPAPKITSNSPTSQSGAPDVPMCRETKSASLSWGIKQSFGDYVTGPIANGTIGTANGVSGNFNWPGRASTYSPETGTGQLSFGGTVTFSGHDGALNMRISNPRVQLVDSNTARLFADVRSTNPAGEVTVDARSVHIANLSISGKRAISGDSVTFTGVPATLTAAGVPAFAEFYEAGSALDSLSITINLGPEIPCADVGSGTDSLPRTGGDLNLAAAGAVFLLFGLSAVGVRRRLRVQN